MHKFNERHIAFEGVSEFYGTNMQADREDHECNGFIKRSRRTIMLIAFFFVSICLLLFILSIYRAPLILYIITVLPLSLTAYVFYDAYKFPSHTQKDYDLIEDLARFVNLRVSEGSDPNFELWDGLGLLPSDHTNSVAPLILEGEYKNCAVKIIYVTTWLKGFLPRRFQEVVFEGHLILLEMLKPFSGETIVLRDQGIGQSKIMNSLKRVGLADPVFERIFEVYGSDQIESRALLSPDLMQAIIELETITSGKYIEFGFVAGHLLISIAKPFPLDAREALDNGAYGLVLAQEFINEISGIFDIIDQIIRHN